MHSHRMNRKSPPKLYPVRWSQSSQGEGRWKDETRNYPMNLSVVYAGDPLTLRKCESTHSPLQHSSLFCAIVVHTDGTVKLSSESLFFFLVCSYWFRGGGRHQWWEGSLSAASCMGSSLQPELKHVPWPGATPWFIGLHSTTEPSRPGRVSLIWSRMTKTIP